jgi:SNF2 family DNA or RNA helicase
MVSNVSEDPKCKTTLIIAPTALLDQWKLEIEMKTNNNFKCLIYHGTCVYDLIPSPKLIVFALGSGKVKSKKSLLQYDVVLTTYQTMALEWPDIETEDKAKAKKKKKKSDNFIETDSEGGVWKKNKKERESCIQLRPFVLLMKATVGLLFQVDVRCFINRTTVG